MAFLDFLGGDKVSDKSISDLIVGDGTSNNIDSKQTKPPVKLVKSDLEAYSKGGLIPDQKSAPKVWDSLLSGDIDLFTVQQKFKQVQPKKNVFSNSDVPKNPDVALQDFANKNLIPKKEDAPATWEAIKGGKLSLEDASKKYQEMLSKPIAPIKAGDSTSNPIVPDKNPPPESIVDPSTIFGVDIATPMGDVETVDFGSPELNSAMNRQKRIENQAALSGFTMGIYQPSELPQSEDEAKAATAMNLYGGIVSAIAGPLKAGVGVTGKLLSKIPAFVKTEKAAEVLGNAIQDLKNVKTVAKAAGTAEEASVASRELLKAQIKKAGLSAAATGAENVVLGAGVGATKSLIQGNRDIKDVLADSLYESAWFTGLGLAMQPIVGAAAKIIGNRQSKETAKVFTGIAKDPNFKALAKNELNPDFVKSIATKTSPEFIGPTSQADIMAKQALDKINKLNPKLGIDVKLLSHPELLVENFGYNVREISNTLFGKGGPLADLPAKNPQLKLLIDTGKHAEALDAVQSVAQNQLMKNSTVKDYMIAPFANDAKSAHKVFTDRVLKKVDNVAKYPELAKNTFNYVNEPTAENAALLMDRANAPRNFINTIKREQIKFKDSRFTPVEVDNIVNDSFSDLIGSFSGQIPKNAFGKLRDTDSILNTSITFNKELNRRFIQAGMQNPYEIDSYFLQAKPELQKGVDATINLTRLQRENQVALDFRRELSAERIEIQRELRVATDANTREALQSRLNINKDMFQTVSQTIQSQTKDINAHKNSLSGFFPDQLNEINDFVSKVYIPNRGGNSFDSIIRSKAAEAVAKKQPPPLSPLGQEIADTEVRLMEGQRTSIAPEIKKGGIENSAQFTGKFGAQDNPYYIAADSELADLMQAFQASGRDVSESMAKKFSFPFLNILNLRRSLQKEFGPNSVFEKFIKRKEDADIAIKIGKQKLADAIDGWGIKQGSVESAWVQRIGEKQATPNDPEFLKLSPASQERVLNAIPKAQAMYKDLISLINAKMESLNLPKIKEREDFFTHFGTVSSQLPELLESLSLGIIKKEGAIFTQNGKAVSVKDAIDFSEGGRLGFWKNDSFDPNRTVFRSEKARRGGEYVNDAIGGLKLYIPGALERIHYADLIRQVDVAKQFAPKNLGNFLQKFKEQHLLRTPDAIDKEASKFLKSASKWYTRRTGAGAILANANVLLQQITSIGTNFGLGGLHSLKALGMMTTKEGKEIISQSNNVALRDSLHMDIDRMENFLKSEYASKLATGVKTAGEFSRQMMEHSLKIFDAFPAKLSFLTGYSRAQQAGLSHKEAIKFADKWTEMIQSNPTRLGQPEFYQSVVMKPFVQFTSFVNNLTASIINDIPTIARTEGSARAISMLLKTYAGMTITNEVMRKQGMPAPFDLVKMMPFWSNYRYGVQGLPGALMSAAATGVGVLKGDEKMVKEYSTKTARSAAALAFPGAGQAMKSWDVYTRSEGKNIFGQKRKGKKEYIGSQKDQYTKDLIFGHTNPEEIKPKIDRQSRSYKNKMFFRKLTGGKIE